MINPTSSPKSPHFSVMLDEVINICSPDKGGIFVDCTFGGGGYTKKLLKFPKTKVVALDRDQYVLDITKEIKRKYPERFFFYQKKFSNIDKVLNEQKADVILFDLGLSSIQLNNFKRGFSFKSRESLDMSMGLTNLSAEQVINSLAEKDLKLIIQDLGEEKEASKIAKNIIKYRSENEITKVNQLVDIIEKSKKRNFLKKINPSTKTFQALRIFVNKEITELIYGIINATKILKPGGKILVLSFHSIEDKIVKYFFNNYSINQSRSSRYLPDDDLTGSVLFEKYQNKVLKPSEAEIFKNPPSRSAKLRFAIRGKRKFVFPNNLIEKFKKYLDLEDINV